MNTRKKNNTIKNIDQSQKGSQQNQSHQVSSEDPKPVRKNKSRTVKKDYKQLLQSPQEQKDSEKRNQQKKKRKNQIKQQKSKRRIRKKGKQAQKQLIQLDSFMDEQSQEAKPTKKEKIQYEVQDHKQEVFRITCQALGQQQKSFSLQAHVSSSSQSQSEGDKNYGQKKQKKNKKTLKSKTKSKKRNKTGLDQQNILEARGRQIQRKNYNIQLPKEVKIKKQRARANFQNISKDFRKVADIQDTLMPYVLQEGMSGPYKYYKCVLKDNKTVFIKQNNMIMYFPRRLLQFKQRILNKVSRSTHRLNFTL